MRNLLISLGLVLLFASPALAIDFTVTGATLTVGYTEPTTNEDGSTLTDLDHTNVYVKVGNGAFVKGANIPASKATGGGVISTPVNVTAPAHATTTVSLYATATDTIGNESVPSVTVTKSIDRLSPASPQ